MPADPDPRAATASSSSSHYREVLPRKGLLFTESQAQLVLCKPKLLPMKSFTLEKMEQMQNDAKRKANRQREEQERAQENEERKHASANFVSESVSFE